MKKRRYFIGMLISGAILLLALGCGGTLLLFRDRSGIPSEDILVNQHPSETIAPAASIEPLPSPSPADAPAESPNAEPEPVSEPHTLNQRLAEMLGEDALSDPRARGMFYDLDGDGQDDFLAYYYSKEDQQYEVPCIHWHCDAPDESNYDNYSFRWTYLLNAMFYEDIDSLSLSAGLFRYNGAEYLGVYNTFPTEDGVIGDVTLFPTSGGSEDEMQLLISYQQQDSGTRCTLWDYRTAGRDVSGEEVPYEETMEQLEEIEAIHYAEENGVGYWLSDILEE